MGTQRCRGMDRSDGSAWEAMAPSAIALVYDHPYFKLSQEEEEHGASVLLTGSPMLEGVSLPL